MFYEKNILIDTFKAENCRVLVYEQIKAKKFIASPLLPRSVSMVLKKATNFFSLVIIPIIRSMAFLLKNAIDLAHVNNCSVDGWEWLFAAKLLGRKCITHERGYPKHNWMSRTRAKYFDCILCVSNIVMDNLRKNNIDKNTVLLYDGIDAKNFRSRIRKSVPAVREEFAVGPAAPFIGVVGNIQSWKGQLTIIRPVHLLRHKYPELVCLLVGALSIDKSDRAYYERLKREITEKELARNVFITGYRGDVPDIMNSLGIILHSSILPEPFGMVVLEGMSLKKPAIATNNGGPKEIIEDTLSGFLVPPDEPRIVAERIDVLMQDRDLRQRIGDNALRRVEEKFNLELFSRSINNVYAGLFLK